MDNNYYIGIDPGLSGGFAAVVDNRILYKMAMPTISFKTPEDKTKTEIDREGVLSILKLCPVHTHVVIEKQEAFRGQDIVSSCTICKNYGILLTALTVAHTYITEEPPKVWQAHFGIVSVKESGGQSTKEQAFHVAQRLYPDASFMKSERSRVVHDGIVDATLIAAYCQFRFAPFEEQKTGMQVIGPKVAPLDVKPIAGVKELSTPLKAPRRFLKRKKENAEKR
ncbi:crossover junction endodeoxyribonuclease [ANMV-1 virus]|nr:crossover junction endodeoxyribonuclease [ANMV-1 virus]